MAAGMACAVMMALAGTTSHSLLLGNTGWGVIAICLLLGLAISVGAGRQYGERLRVRPVEALSLSGSIALAGTGLVVGCGYLLRGPTGEEFILFIFYGGVLFVASFSSAWLFARSLGFVLLTAPVMPSSAADESKDVAKKDDEGQGDDDEGR